MKVVLFCGGRGMRLREYSDQMPKPLVPVGPRPVLWHLMMYYAHYGHKEFIICLGHGGHTIKEFFLKYDEWATNDFVLSEGGSAIEMLRTDIHDWRITFVDTGLDSTIGERLRRVREHVIDDDYFLANYADGLSDLSLDKYIHDFQEQDKVGCLISVPAPHTFHIIHADDEDHVTQLVYVGESPLRINGGYFVFKREIFDYLLPGEELVLEPFQRLIDERQLIVRHYDGFWKNMDTFKDKVELDAMYSAGHPPWKVWE